MCFPSKWFFGVEQDVVKQSRNRTQPSSRDWIHWFNNFLSFQYPAHKSGNSKWNWSKLRRLQASKAGYYIQTHQWITFIFEFMNTLKTWASGEVPWASNIWELHVLAQRASRNSNVFWALLKFNLKFNSYSLKCFRAKVLWNSSKRFSRNRHISKKAIPNSICDFFTYYILKVFKPC